MTIAINPEEKIKELLYQIFAKGRAGKKEFYAEYLEVEKLIKQIKKES